MKSIYYLIFLSFFINLNCFAQSADYRQSIDSLIAVTSPRPFNGVILITQKGKIVYQKAIGYSDFEKRVPLALSDNFRIMSNSKQITAVLILREVEKGTIDLNSPIRKYLPHLTQTWADTVTVHQLLNFSGGVVEINKPLAFKPGTDFLYGVAPYTLLGNILTRVTGKTYVDAANSLFKELKMNHTFCYESAADQPNVVNGYRLEKNSFIKQTPPLTQNQWVDFVPAGGIISNAIDLNTWDTHLHGGKILKPETYKLMTRYDITARHDAFGSLKIGYGYGLRINDQTPVTHIGHAGKGLGFVSIKVYYPKNEVDLIVLENIYHEDSNLHYYFENKLREIVINSSLTK
ncbi:MAG: serine hydrolase domain-containing protein [Cyclobacteriaceae bacterium]